MRKLNPIDLEYIVRKIPKKLKELMAQYPGDIFIAGGFIRSCIAHEKINDIDVFVSDHPKAETALAFFKLGKGEIHKTDYAYSFKLSGQNIQIIHRWTFGTPTQIINHFDFTIAQAVVWSVGDTFDSDCVDFYYEDLAAKRLIYTNPLYPEAGASLLRVLKFRARGYHPTLWSLACIVGNINPDGESAPESYKSIVAKLVEVDPNAAPIIIDSFEP